MAKAQKKRGPRFNRGDAVPKMLRRARRMVSKQGVAGLSFRKLADGMKPKLSHSAPLHHFGAISGLLGAIAGEVFAELADELRAKRESQPAGKETLIAMARHLAAFSLANPSLYQAIHSPVLWEALDELKAPTRGRSITASALARQRARDRWVEQAFHAREAAFHEFVQAASDLLQTAETREEHFEWRIARMVTTLVDGYLFQYLNEKVTDGNSKDEAIEVLCDLVELALGGVTDLN